MIVFELAIVTGQGDRRDFKASTVTFTMFVPSRATVLPKQLLHGCDRNSAKYAIIGLTAIFLQNFWCCLFGKLK